MNGTIGKNKTLGLVITDGVGFRNFVLSDFLKASDEVFNRVVIFSAIPATKIESHIPFKTQVVELEDYSEHGSTWFFRKAKEIAHLKNNEKDNFGIQDNLKTNFSTSHSRRGRLTRLIYKITAYFHSEKWIKRFYKLQQRTFGKVPQNKRYKELLEEYKPDVLFFTHQRPPYIAPLIHAAEKQNIKTCSFIFSWDNLASKGRMAGDFNNYLVWSELMRNELLQFYKEIGVAQVQIVGTPQFEPYVMKNYEGSEQNFFDRFELNNKLRTICFSCGDISTSPNDPLYIESIAEAIENSKLIEKVNFLVRTSPAEEPERFDSLKAKYPFIKWNYPDWQQSRSDHSEIWSQRIPSEKDLTDLRMILEFSDLGINMCSTMSLDFMIFDKPVINPVFGNEENELYNDQKYLKYAHYERVVKSGAVSIVKNKEELDRKY